MVQLLLRCLACLALFLCTFPAAAKPAAKAPKADAVATVDADAGDSGSDSDGDEGGGTESAGIECLPAISEVETRRPIPFSCSVTKDDVENVELRYKAPGRKKWTKLRLRKTGKEWTGEIPCLALSKRGALKLSIVGLDSDDKTVARIGGVEIRVVDASNEPAPAYPGREPPMRCFDANECPPELKGSPACPGTKAAAGLHSWGSACGKSSECQQGLACISGSCDKPAKCESKEDCGTGECESGTCTYPDPDEIASRLGPPKVNWIGLHFGADILHMSYAPGVCGVDTADSKDYTCYNGSEANPGTDLNPQVAGNVPSGFGLSTMRVLASYDRWFGRLGAAVRVGFAFGGAPKDFSPIHLEARVMYSMRQDQLNKRFRPYIGIAAGMAEVDSHSKVQVFDCKNAQNPDGSNNTAACKTWRPGEGALPKLQGASSTKLDAYKSGSGVFFGPTLGFLFALANDQGIQANLNVMFPDVAFEPSVGYVFGL
jgi:hypothetical protein